MATTLTNTRVHAAEAYIKALRTGEPGAAQEVGRFLDDAVVLAVGNDEVSGREQVIKRITGQWPLTPVYVHAGFSTPRQTDNQLSVDADFPPMGAAPSKLHLTFTFNANDKIVRIEQRAEQAPPQQVDALPEYVKGIINGALANSTPIVVAYADEQGQPILSLRGSTQVYGDTQLCIWVRNASGGIVNAMARNPRVSLLYRDSKTRTTLIMQGRGHIETDDEVRRRVYDLAPEVEQNHDPQHKGAALVIDLLSVQGTTVRGPVRMQRQA